MITQWRKYNYRQILTCSNYGDLRGLFVLEAGPARMAPNKLELTPDGEAALAEYDAHHTTIEKAELEDLNAKLLAATIYCKRVLDSSQTMNGSQFTASKVLEILRAVQA